MVLTESKRQSLKEYRQKNKEKIKIVAKARYLRNREHYLVYKKGWRENHKDHISKQGKEYYQNNKISVLTKQRIHNNKPEIKERTQSYGRNYAKKHPRKYKLLNAENKFKLSVNANTLRLFKKTPTCEICGSKNNLEWHHWRYRLPLQKKDFNTLCKDCHTIQHRITLGGKIPIIVGMENKQ